MQETLVQSLSREEPEEGRGNPLQCSCLENPLDRRAWQATVHGVSESRTPLRLSKANIRGVNIWM